MAWCEEGEASSLPWIKCAEPGAQVFQTICGCKALQLHAWVESRHFLPPHIHLFTSHFLRISTDLLLRPTFKIFSFCCWHFKREVRGFFLTSFWQNSIVKATIRWKFTKRLRTCKLMHILYSDVSRCLSPNLKCRALVAGAPVAGWNVLHAVSPPYLISNCIHLQTIEMQGRCRFVTRGSSVPGGTSSWDVFLFSCHWRCCCCLMQQSC